jgi:hypothetical protein
MVRAGLDARFRGHDEKSQSINICYTRGNGHMLMRRSVMAGGLATAGAAVTRRARAANPPSVSATEIKIG